jgi:uncharacterized membrane protein YcaP (DUF421 family)
MPSSDNILVSAASGMALGAIAILWVILLVRLVGLRALAKMTGFDFVTTVAVGSLIATAGVSTSWHAFAKALGAIFVLFLLQWLLAKWRVHSKLGQHVLGNQPILLMEHGEFNEAAMLGERIAKADIYAKMRESGVLDPSSIRAVVLERTGDVSIIKDGPVDDAIMSDISRRYR